MTQPPMRMQMRQTRAPQALPALLVGIGSLILSVTLGALLPILMGIGAVMLAAMAYADTRSHGYSGVGLAMAGAALGFTGAVIAFLAMAFL